MTLTLRTQLAALFAGLALSIGALAGPVDVNTADAETLAAELDGVGITKARAIVAYRNANGPFTTVESLTEVTGIGARTLELNRANILIDERGERTAEDATEE